jgi:hypothetical protein
MNESHLAEAVHSAFDDATAGLTARPDAARHARRAGRRRRTARGLLTGVPVVALAGASAAFALHGTGTSAPAAPHPAAPHPAAPHPAAPHPAAPHPAAPHPAALTVAYVTRQAETALDQTSHYIVRTTEQMPGATVITWTDPVTGNDRQLLKASETIVQWSQPYTAGNYRHWKITVADMGKQTWWSDTVQSSAPEQQEPPSSTVALSPFTSTAQIKQALSSGQVTIAGHGNVNGQAAIDLRLTTKKTQFDYWVNAKTYQPAEIAVGSGHAIDVNWLPRTSTLVTQTNTPQIPAGFQHVSAPAQR